MRTTSKISSQEDNIRAELQAGNWESTATETTACQRHRGKRSSRLLREPQEVQNSGAKDDTALWAGLRTQEALNAMAKSRITEGTRDPLNN